VRAGRLDRRITIQRFTTTYSPSGEPIETWTDLVSRRWAEVRPVRGDERFSAPQLAAKEQVEFRIRWGAAVADVSPLDRIIYPAVEPASPAEEIAESRVYDILAVHEIGRRDGLRIIAARRVDGVPAT